MPSVCSHFWSLIAAILREQGVPARAPCGFGAYFVPGRFEDHWVAEYWNTAEQRWVLVDAQLDHVQRSAFRINFDPTDVPHERFILAGDAWKECRAGRAGPELFGLSIIKEQGLWWIAQNLIRDLASLNRLEMLPWDVWGIMPKPTGTISDDDGTFLAKRQKRIVVHGGCGSLRLDERLALAPKSLSQVRALHHTRQRIPAMRTNKTG